MKNLIQNSFLFLSLFMSITVNGQICDPVADRVALMELYNATNGDQWDNKDNWDSNLPLDDWYGVTTNADGCVICLDLDGDLDCEDTLPGEGNGIVGMIPDLNLPHLEHLSLSNNNFTGEIPNFSKLPNLQIFWCSDNKLTGAIPNFSKIPNLQVFDCYNNNLSGNIPDFSNLPNLESVECSFNNISGSIPDFPNSPKLRILYCYYNNLHNNIPDFSNLPNLEFFSCDKNNLSGPIPNFSNTPKLKSFGCRGNNLNENIPNFSNLPNLISFSCSENELSGTIPNFSNILKLKYFSCNDNELTGMLPDFSHLQNLNTFYCFTNHLEGCYPMYICHIDFNSENNPDLPWEGDHTPYCELGEDPCGPGGGEVNCCDPIPLNEIEVSCVGNDLIICLPEIVGCDPVPFYPNPISYLVQLIPIVNGDPDLSQAFYGSTLIPNLSPDSPNCLTITDGEGYDSTLDYEISVFYYADCNDGNNIPDNQVHSNGNVFFEGDNCIGDPYSCCDLELTTNPLECGSFEICMEQYNPECELLFFGDPRGNIHPSMISNLNNPGFPIGCLTVTGYSSGNIADFTIKTEVAGCGQMTHHIYVPIGNCGGGIEIPTGGRNSGANNNVFPSNTARAFPNPFSNDFQIQLTSEKTEAYQLSIYSLEGKAVFKSSGDLVKGQNSLLINNLNVLPSGIYYYQLMTESKNFSNKILKE